MDEVVEARIAALMHAVAFLYAGRLAQRTPDEARLALEVLAQPFADTPEPADRRRQLILETLEQLADQIVRLLPPT